MISFVFPHSHLPKCLLIIAIRDDQGEVSTARIPFDLQSVLLNAEEKIEFFFRAAGNIAKGDAEFDDEILPDREKNPFRGGRGTSPPGEIEKLRPPVGKMHGETDLRLCRG